MIAELTGLVTKKLSNGQTIINVDGVGYGVKTNSKAPIGQETSLLIYEHIREDAYDLYGFESERDLLLFKQLISISGVGPKIAILVMEQGDIATIKKAVESSDVEYFNNISGIGKKMAQKIILELQSKIGQESDLNILASSSHQDIKSALESLGYKPKEFASVVSKIPEDLTTTASQLTWALKQLR